jgi:hypothetical protein
MNSLTYLHPAGGTGSIYGPFAYFSFGRTSRRPQATHSSDARLKPIRLAKFLSRGALLRFKSPAEFTPSLNEAGDLLVVDAPRYSLHVYAKTRQSLTKEIKEYFGMAWQAFVVEGDKKLTPKAKRLGRILAEEIEEEATHGSR